MKKNFLIRILSVFLIIILVVLAPLNVFAREKRTDEELARLTKYKDPDCVTFDVNVKYNQEEARSFLELINEFRSGKNNVKNATDSKTWYYDANNSKKYVENLQPLTYNYRLEEFAMLRAAECGVYMDPNHITPCGLGTVNEATVYYRESGVGGECIGIGPSGNLRKAIDAFNGFAEELELYSGQGHRRSMLKSDHYYFAAAQVIFDSNYSVFVLEFADSEFSEVSLTPTDISNDFQHVEVESSSSHILDIRSDNIQLNYNDSFGLDNIAFKADFKADVNTKGNKNVPILPHGIEWSIENSNIAEIKDDEIVTKSIGKTNLVSEFAGHDIIVPLTVAPVDISSGKLIIEPEEVSYNDYKAGTTTLEPMVKVVVDNKTVSADNYSLIYDTNNNKPGVGSVEVKGVGNYTGYLTGNYNIVCDHNYIENGVKEPTCTEAGGALYTCSICSDEYVLPTIEPLKHEYVLDNHDDECHYYKCTRCNDIYSENHDFIIEGIEPTCTTPAIIVSTCTICSAKKSEEVGTPLGHMYVQDKVVAPTCTEQGYTVYRCKNGCGGERFKDYTNATGHNYVSKVTQTATCQNDGIRTYTCKNCNDTYTEVIKKTSHIAGAVKEEIITNATCTSTGLKKVTTYCKYCNEVISSEDITISKTAHLYEIVDWKTAFCEESGYKKYECSECKTSYTETVKALGHNYYQSVYVSADCKTNGYKQYSCTRCDSSYKETIKAGHKYKVSTTKATTKKNGFIVVKCSVCGNIDSKTTIYYPKTITLSKTSYVYNGKVQKPSVIVKDSKGNKVATSNYTITYSTGRKNVGKYTVTVKFKGNYSGTVKKTFTIKPKATSVNKLTAGKKKFTVKWKKLTTQTTGYQIQYATNSKFTQSKKTITVKKNSTTSKTVSKLEAKKKYYVRVRTYKTVKVNGKSTKIYSSWSKAKVVTTKK